MTKPIGFEVKLAVAYEEAIEDVVEALKTEGFGVLTRIDVKNTLKEKLDKDFRPYIILGACNPPLAYRALSNDANMGLLLPCNVTVEEDPEGGSIVRIADPEVVLEVGNLESNLVVCDVAAEARLRLSRVAESLTQGRNI